MCNSNKDDLDLWEKIRKQYDALPYPPISVKDSGKNDLLGLYNHNIINAFYRRNKTLIDSTQAVILDAACGSGFKTLLLARANPGAKIVGFDLSQHSLEVAKARFIYHGLECPDFYCTNLYDLPKLGLTFDYINLDETLYFFEDIGASLAVLKSVLKPDGIIRTNLHSYWQRNHFYRAQNIFKMMGLFNENPGEFEINNVKSIFKSLKNTVNLKQLTWRPELEDDHSYYAMNFFLQGDRGYTIEELFQALEKAELEFISMLKWREWNLLDLFENVEELPSFLALSLPSLSIAEKLHLFEMFNPVHRLFDFWCGHPERGTNLEIDFSQWTDQEWLKATVYLHPQLKTAEVQQKLLESINLFQPFEISKYLPIHPQTSIIDTTLVSSVYLPLLEKEQTIRALIERWCTLHPLDPVTLKETTPTDALNILSQFLIHQENLGYVLLQ